MKKSDPQVRAIMLKELEKEFDFSRVGPRVGVPRNYLQQHFIGQTYVL